MEDKRKIGIAGGQVRDRWRVDVVRQVNGERRYGKGRYGGGWRLYMREWREIGTGRGRERDGWRYGKGRNGDGWRVYEREGREIGTGRGQKRE